MKNECNQFNLFAKNLVAEIGPLQKIYEDHIEQNEEILPYVLMDEFCRFIINNLQQRAPGSKNLFKEFSAYLEGVISDSDEEMAILIRTTFCETIDSLWRETDLHKWLLNNIGPLLKKELSVTGM